VFCTEEEREDRALRRKMLIESRKLYSKPIRINQSNFSEELLLSATKLS
jgi:hypothetical protein